MQYFVVSFLQLEELAVAFISQLQSQYLNEELANQVIKNLVFIAKVAKLNSQSTNANIEEAEDSENDNTSQKRLSVPWLVRKMVREANHEAVSNTKTTIKVSSTLDSLTKKSVIPRSWPVKYWEVH